MTSEVLVLGDPVLDIEVVYQDEHGKTVERKNIEQDIPELLQHEMDHLDGVLATERAISAKNIIDKTEYNKNLNYYGNGIEYGVARTV